MQATQCANFHARARVSLSLSLSLSVFAVRVSVRVSVGGAGIACWKEHRDRDLRVAGSNPDRSGGRIYFSRVNSVC